MWEGLGLVHLVGVVVAVAMAPQEDEYQSEKHATEVGEMGHVVGTEEAFIQLDDGIADDEPLGLDGHKEIEVDALVGEHHAKGEEYAIDSTRGTNSRCGWKFENQTHSNMGGSCTESTDEVIDDETLGAPIVLEHVTEHPESEHVEEDMPEAGMHEHVGEGLPDTEESRSDRPQAEQIYGRNKIILPIHSDCAIGNKPHQRKGGDKHQHIYYEKMLDTLREHRETLRGILGHFLIGN